MEDIADVKWIKIVTDIFDDQKIRFIETMPNGDEIIVVWFKLICLAGKSNCNGFLMMTDKIAYTEEMLSSIFSRDIKLIHMAIDTFQRLDMIEVIDNRLYISNWEKHQNAERLAEIKKHNRIRQARFREKKQLTNNDSNAKSVTQPLLGSYSNAIDKDKEEDNTYAHFYEQLWNMYPVKKGKARISLSQKKKLHSIGLEEMTRAINRYKKEIEGKDKQYIQHGSTFFNSGYVDYLDANYEQTKSTLKEVEIEW